MKDTKTKQIQEFLDRVQTVLEAADEGWPPEQCLLELRMAAHQAKFQTKKAGQ